jgi:hypothetical protein
VERLRRAASFNNFYDILRQKKIFAIYLEWVERGSEGKY